MLHMLVNVHNPESCAFRSEQDDEVLTAALEQVGSISTDRGAALRNWWVNTGSHTFFILIDAPNAHVIDEIVREVGLTGRTHTQVYAVGDLGELMASSKEDKD